MTGNVEPSHIFCRRRCQLLSLVIVFVAACHQNPTQSATHFILITADTWRGDHVLTVKGETMVTPHLDEFARSAMWYQQANSASNVTSPGVAGFLTGLDPHRSGVLENVHVLSPDVPTLASTLQKAGFVTGGFVTNPVVGPGYGFENGFETYDLIPPRGGLTKARGDDLVSSALEWLDDRTGSDRLFLWIHFMEPHGPYTPPDTFTNDFSVGAFGEPVAVALLPPGKNSGKGGVPHYQQLGLDPVPTDGRDYSLRYAAEVRSLDAEIGRFLEELRNRGILQEAVTVITSDHGEALLDDHGFFFSHDNGLTQDQLHVPLFLRFPGCASGTTIATPVSTLDIMPTVLPLLGVSSPEGTDGIDLRTTHDRPIIHRSGGAVAVRFGGWKYISDATQRRAALFDLESDQSESHDISGLRPEIVLKLEQTLTAMDARTALSQPIDRNSLTEAEQEALEALGYVEAE